MIHDRVIPYEGLNLLKNEKFAHFGQITDDVSPHDDIDVSGKICMICVV